MAKQTFTSGQVLTATQMNNLQTNDFNLSTSVQTTGYTLQVGDRGTRVIANSGSAIAFTVNTSVFSAGDIVEIHNIGAGTLTITAGTATVTSADVLTVAQWQGGTLYFTSASAAIWFPRAKQTGVVQIKSTTKTDTFTTSSTTFTDVTGLSVDITPTSSSNRIFVTASLQAQGQSATTDGFAQLVRGSTAIGIGDAAGSRARAGAQILLVSAAQTATNVMSNLDSPATTSSTTYKVQIRAAGAGTLYVNRTQTDTDSSAWGRFASTITVFEVTP